MRYKFLVEKGAGGRTRSTVGVRLRAAAAAGRAAQALTVRVFFPKTFDHVARTVSVPFHFTYSEQISHVVKYYCATRILIAVWYSII